MSDSEEIPDHEELIRALTLPKWDPVNERMHLSAFKDSRGDLSVENICLAAQ